MMKEIDLTPPDEVETHETEISHTTLRLATFADIPQLMEIGKEMFAASTYNDIQVDITKVRSNLEAAIAKPDEYLVLVSFHPEDRSIIVGALIAFVFHPIYSKDKMACELLMYLKPEYRKGRRGLDLMKAYEYWAKMLGCKIAQYGWLPGKSPEKMETLYEKTGAKYVEKVYYKLLQEE